LNRFRIWSLWLASLLNAGCASTPSPAPVKDASYASNYFSPAPPGFYRIQRGDTLFKIAFQYGLDIHQLAAWNDLPDPGVIVTGNLLSLVPAKPKVATASLAVKPSTVARSMNPESPVDEDVSSDKEPDAWSWPSRGPLLGLFGDGLNKGIDIGGKRGRSVRAAAAGRVVYAGSSLRGYGKLIIIRHGKSLLSAYAHNARILVAENQAVILGQTIAEMGDTDTDRVKLHFEIREYGKPVDPLIYLPKQS